MTSFRVITDSASTAELAITLLEKGSRYTPTSRAPVVAPAAFGRAAGSGTPSAHILGCARVIGKGP
ncbi:MAG TPA: hypothetical protein VFV67_23795 [Actinophytocola sp.]|nr:hypothetical protein [Actinophytocola sp.]